MVTNRGTRQRNRGLRNDGCALASALVPNGPTAPRRGGVVDLTVVPEVTTTLLSRPLDWRVRVVEHLDVETSSSCIRRRSLQVAPLRPLLPPKLTARADEGLIILNVVSVPRRALVDFDVSGPDGAPAFLLPRAELSRREAAYLAHLAEDAGIAAGPGLQNLWAAAVGHTRTAWSVRDDDAMDRIGDYLADGFAATVDEKTLVRWQELDHDISNLLRPYADETVPLSTCEHPILALPDLADQVDVTTPGWTGSLTAALQSYLHVLRRAKRAADEGPSAATELLNSWADYGRNYDMMVATTVPLDAPFVLKYSERRQLDIDTTGTASQGLVLNDAISNHVVLNIFDANVKITGVQVNEARTDTPAFGALSDRHTDQTYAIYAHDQDRTYRAVLTFSLAPRPLLQIATYAAAVLLVLVAVGVAYEHPRRLQDLALIVGPSALAISIVTVREATTLTAKLRTRSTLVLLLAFVLLVVCATLSYLAPALRALLSMVLR